MPIILAAMTGSLQFRDNQVFNCSGLKGFLKVELAQQILSPTHISNNTFQGVAGYLYSGVLNLMKTYSSDSHKQYETNDNCGGFQVTHNSFIECMVCPVPQELITYQDFGLVKVQCNVNQSLRPTDQIYKKNYPFWSPLEDVGRGDFTSSLLENNFEGNLIGRSSSLILIQEVPFVFISRNTYSRNGDLFIQNLVDNFAHPGFREGLLFPKLSTLSQSDNTGSFVTILGGLGLEISEEQIKFHNWKENLLSNKYSSYAYVERVRGVLNFTNLQIHSPPIGICNHYVASLSNTINELCSQNYVEIADSNSQPLIKISNFADPLFRSLNNYQTTISISNCSFSNFMAAKPDSEVLLSFISQSRNSVFLQIQNTNFTNILPRQQSALLDLTDFSANLTNLHFQAIGNNWLYMGPAYLFKLGAFQIESKSLHFQNIAMNSVFTFVDIFDLTNTNTAVRLELFFRNIHTSSLSTQSALFHSLHRNLLLQIDNWHVTDMEIRNTFTLQNSFFIFERAYNVTISQLSIECAYWTSCSLFYVSGNYTELNIYNSEFQMLPGYSEYVQNIERNPFTIYANKVHFKNIKAKGFSYAGEYGGVVSVEVSSQFSDYNSIYSGNRGAYHGGVYFLRGYMKKYAFNNCTFEGNEAHSGGVFYSIQETEIELHNCKFNNNRAGAKGGAILVSESAFFTISDSVFTANEADDEGAVIYAINSAGSVSLSLSQFDTSRLKDSQIENNGCESSGSTIFAIFCKVEFTGNEFSNNIAGKGTKGVKAIFSQIEISRSQFKDSFAINPITSRLVSSFIIIGDSSKVKLIQSTFEGSRVNAPTISISGDAEVEINNCSLYNNTEKNYPTVEASGFQKFEMRGSLFQNNAGSPVSDLSLTKSEKLALITNTSFTGSLNGDSLHISDTSLHISLSQFSQRSYNHSYDTGRQSAINCDHCDWLLVNKSIFQHLQVDHAIRLSHSTQREAMQSVISNNNFQEISFYSDGGAVRVQNYNSIRVQNNTFAKIQNSLLYGGGVYIGGKLAKEVFILDNQFQENRALVGAGFAYDFYQPLSERNSFTGNKAAAYGHNKAGYPSSLVLLTYQNYLKLQHQDLDSLTPLETSLEVKHHRSGDVLPQFYLAIVDTYGQITTTVSQKLVFEIHVQASQYTPVVSASQQIMPDKGIYRVQEVKVITEPGVHSQVIIRSENAFDYSLPDVQKYLTEGSIEFTLQIDTALCQPGYAFNNNGECTFCEAGTYSLEQPLDPNYCIDCPLQAECFGGTQISPLPSYWRAGSQSLNFYNCFNPAACIGSTLESYNPQGACAQGYEGILCSQCKQSMTSNGNFECGKCPSHWQNVLIIFVTCLATVVAIILIIKVTFSAIDHKNNSCSIYLKIMTNHLQLIYLVSTFDLSWPQEVQTFQASTQPVANISQRIVSLDCFIEKTVTTRPFYFKLLLTLASPIMIGLVVALFWCMILRNESRAHLWSKSVASLTIILFIIHPSLTSTIFQAFLIEDKNRLVQEMSEVCWEGSHLYWALGGGLPGLLFWVVGIPLVVWHSMHSYSSQLHHREVREKYGFLYKGFKPGSYFWECILMFKKVGIAFISVFLNGSGKIVQALVVFLFLIFFMVITQKWSPYLSRKLNQLEMVSLFALGVTFYCGIFFLSATDPSATNYVPGRDYLLSNGARWFFFSCIIGSNLVFLTLWIVRLVQDLKDFVREKYRRLYICLCLCNRKDILRIEDENVRHNQINEEIISTIEELERLVKVSKKLYIQKREIPEKNKLEALIFSTTLQFRKMRVGRRDSTTGDLDTREDYVGQWRHRSRSLGMRAPTLEEARNFEEENQDNDVGINFNDNYMSVQMVTNQQPGEMVKKRIAQKLRKDYPHNIFLRSESQEKSIATSRADSTEFGLQQASTQRSVPSTFRRKYEGEEQKDIGMRSSSGDHNLQEFFEALDEEEKDDVEILSTRRPLCDAKTEEPAMDRKTKKYKAQMQNYSKLRLSSRESELRKYIRTPSEQGIINLEAEEVVKQDKKEPHIMIKSSASLKQKAPKIEARPEEPRSLRGSLEKSTHSKHAEDETKEAEERILAEIEEVLGEIEQSPEKKKT